MSLLTQQVSANSKEFYFLRANVSSLNVNAISTGQITAGSVIGDVGEISSFASDFISSGFITADIVSTSVLEVDDGIFSTFSTVLGDVNELQTSTIFTTQLTLDSQTLNATPTELLLNGIPLVVTSNLSSIADWSLDPAISTVNMNNNNIIGCQTLTSINGMFQNLMVQNVFAVSTYTSTVSSLAEVADYGYFSNLFATAATLSNLSANTLSTNNGYFSSLTANQGTFSSIATDSAVFSTLVSPVVSTQALFVSSVNNNELTASTIAVSSLATQVISSVFLQASSISGTFVSTLGAEIRQGLMSSIVFSPSLNPSLGGVNVNLGLGGILGNVIGWGAGVLGAATGVVALGTSIAALSMGRQTQYIDNSRYELVNGTSQLQFSTLGNTFSTIYRFNSSSDPQRVPGEEIFISTINPPGLAVRTMSDPIYTLSTPNSTIQAFGEWVPLPLEIISSFNDLTTSSFTVSSINGEPVGNFLNQSTSDWALYPAQSTIAFSTGVAAVIRSANTATDSMAIGAQNIQLLTAFTQTPNMICSTISTAYIYGANPNLFGLGVQGLEIDAANVWISSPQTNIAGLTNTSTVGSLLFKGREAFFSTANIVGASTITLSTLNTAGSAGQPVGRLGVIGNDVDFGQQDIWCQQVRLGAANPSGSAQTEIIFYSPDNLTTRGLGLAGADATIRVQSTINSGTNNGYLLDTTINRPFFSTLGGVSTALMATYPSTTLGVFGVSTLSVIPPLTYLCSALTSTTQLVAGASVSTPAKLEQTTLNVGGFTLGASTITVPVPGYYEIGASFQFATTSGGTNEVEFWLTKNGAAVAQTNSRVGVVNNGDTLGNISLWDTAAANDNYGWMFYSSDNNMAATATAAGATPAIPALIMNIRRIG